MIQPLATFLFFYVFVLGAIALTWYVVVTIRNFFRKGNGKQ